MIVTDSSVRSADGSIIAVFKKHVNTPKGSRLAMHRFVVKLRPVCCIVYKVSQLNEYAQRYHAILTLTLTLSPKSDPLTSPLP
jgi:hypothetical protein